ncbi:unnamed protein product [Hymenolepis diminuta]|uniref:Uncharacterized protein n=2 Tax=Hymenolepis diminuta TaxID=6216 RepID=A0A564Z113_HYMDI|nr:unnamed protein product [Hymenolepis diminuta]
MKVTSLSGLLQEIAKERSKTLELECRAPSRNPKINSSRDLFWAALFKSTFCSLSVLHLIDSGSHDDLLFFVRQTNSIFAKPDVRVFRQSSPNIPPISDLTVNWENTVHLNLITHCFVYVVTLGICTRSGAQEMEILKKKSLVVYASPSYRPMDSKGTQETIVYPHIVFPIDNFEEVFECCVLRDSECLCVELTAYDRSGALQGVLFEGVVRYSVLKGAHDVSFQMCSRGSWRFTPMKTVSGMLGGTLGDLYSYKGSPRTFVRMLARRSEGIAEVTIQQEPEATIPPNVPATSISRHYRRLSTTSNISIETDENIRPEELIGKRRLSNISYRSATSSPLHGALFYSGSCALSGSSNFGSRRGSATSQIHQLVTGEGSGKALRRRQFPSTKMGPISGPYRKARSDSDNLNSSPLDRFRPTKNCIEIDSSTFEDEFDDQPLVTSPTIETKVEETVSRQATFGQAWQWFKERRRITSPPIRAAVTYISVPWYLIISGILEAKKTPILTSSFMENLGRDINFP